jgi:hypothetical protein
MSWRDQLQPCSLGGVTAHVIDRSHEFGRRHHNHEYPKRDENFAEDMGRATRKWSVKLYLVGDDYMARRDALIAVCEREGPHSYVDRWGRSHLVVVEPSSLSEHENEGRYCTFDLKLMAAGASPVTGVAIAAVAQVIGGASAVSAMSIAAFASTYLPGQLIDTARLSALSDLGDLAGILPGLDAIGARAGAATVIDVDLTGAVRALVPAARLDQIGRLAVRGAG